MINENELVAWYQRLNFSSVRDCRTQSETWWASQKQNVPGDTLSSNNGITTHRRSRARVWSTLSPHAIGTPYVESLTSYVTRLAEAHVVFVWRLMLQILAESRRVEFHARRYKVTR